MYFTVVYPKRGSSYYGPSREMCQGWKRKRDACAAAEEISEDDSVKSVSVNDGTPTEFGAVAQYINGKRQKP